jgi:hypothetical protein
VLNRVKEQILLMLYNNRQMITDNETIEKNWKWNTRSISFHQTQPKIQHGLRNVFHEHLPHVRRDGWRTPQLYWTNATRGPRNHAPFAYEGYEITPNLL